MNLVPIQRLTRDLRDASITLSTDEARFLVDAYYQMQENRKRSYNQERALDESEEPHTVIGWLAEQSGSLERKILRALDAYATSKPIGQWARSIIGIGPVISAGLLAHINLEPWHCNYRDDPCTERTWFTLDISPQAQEIKSSKVKSSIEQSPYTRKDNRPGTVKEKAPKEQRVINTHKEQHLECGHKRIETVGHIWRFAGLDPTS